MKQVFQNYILDNTLNNGIRDWDKNFKDENNDDSNNPNSDDHNDDKQWW